jgi:hypothetical protein
MKNHPLLGSVSLVSRLLLNFRGQASRCVKQAAPTGRHLGLFAASHCYYVMLMKSEVFQARHVYLDAAFEYSIPRSFSQIRKCLHLAKSRGKESPDRSQGWIDASLDREYTPLRGGYRQVTL